MSSTLDSGVLNNTLKEILRTSSALTYGSIVLPSMDSESKWPPVNASRPASLRQWFLERHNFEESVTKEYASMQSSEMRLIVAGTGVGKTTRLPYSIANTHKVCGVVLMPSYDIMLDAHLYMSKNPQFKTVNFVRLKPSITNKPLSGTTVYYATAADFLAMLNRQPNLCRTLKIDFVFLDEQHVPRPDYTFFQYLTAANVLKGTKVFFATATAAGSADMSMEGGVKRNVQKKPAALFPYHTSDVTRNCPMHEKQISGKTLIFLIDDAQIADWKQYYEGFDIPVGTYGHTANGSELPKIRELLKLQTVVILTVSRLETSITLDIDTVISVGKTKVLRYDMINSKVILEVRNHTDAELVQRCGRVARFKPGTAIYPDLEPAEKIDHLSYEQSVYVFLWAKKFNFSIKNSAIAAWEDAFSGMTQETASILLTSRLPPILLYAYLSQEGFYSGFAHLKKVLYESSGIETSLDSCQDAVSRWSIFNTGPQPYLTEPQEFRARIEPPPEWIPLFHWAFLEYLNGGKDSIGFDARTYAPTEVNLSAVVKQKVKNTFRRREPTSVSVCDANLVTPAITTARRALDASSAFYTSAEPFQITTTHLPARGRIVEEDEDIEDEPLNEVSGALKTRVKDWVSSLPTEEIPRRVMDIEPNAMKVRNVHVREGVVRVFDQKSSNSSGERNELHLIRVDPMKYMYEKLYPADDTARRIFLDRQNVERSDKQKVKDMLAGKRNFSTLERAFEDRRDRQTAYFLSTLRVHNGYVMESAQLAASESLTRSLFNDYEAKMSHLQRRIEAVTKLLKMCAKENFFVAVDKRVHHSATPKSASYLRSRTFSTDIDKAEFSLILGDQSVTAKIMALKEMCVPVRVFDEHTRSHFLKCHVWLNGEHIYGVAHAFSDEYGTIQVPSDAVDVHKHSDELIVFNSKHASESFVPVGALFRSAEIYVLAAGAGEGQEVKVHGPYAVYRIASTWHFDGDFVFGYSGALCVDAKSGMPLGLYVGSFMELNGRGHGTLVSF